jgi:hypothetical protein
MKHMKLRSATDVRSHAVAGFVREAVALNERLGNPTKRG